MKPEVRLQLLRYDTLVAVVVDDRAVNVEVPTSLRDRGIGRRDVVGLINHINAALAKLREAA